MIKRQITRIKSTLRKRRQILNGTIGEYLSIFLLYFAITIPLTGFVIFHISSQIFSGPGDATAGFLWLNYVDSSVDPLINFTSLTNYPFGEATGGVTLMSYFAYWFPMRLLSFVFNPIAALNIVMLFGYSSAAMAMYWLVKRITGRKSISFFAGYAVAFVPYAMLKSVGHFSYIFSGIFSALIAVFITFWQKPNLKKAVALALLLALALYTDGYFILMAVLLSVGMLLSGIIYSLVWRERKAVLVKRLAGIGAALLCFLVFISPLLIIQLTHSGQVSKTLDANRSDISLELNAYRSNVSDFILPPRDNALLQGDSELLSLHTYNNQRSNGSENNNYISFVIYALCAGGLVLILFRVMLKKHSKLQHLDQGKWRTVTLVVLLCAVTVPMLLSFMFSPNIGVFGVTIPLPGQFMIDRNIALWRVMSRLFVVLNVLIVLAGAISLWLLTTRFAKKGEVFTKYSVAVTWLCLAIVAGGYTSYYPSRPFDFNTGLPQTYYWLKDQASVKSIAELPTVDPLDMYTSDYATAQIVHGKAIMNLKGAGETRLNSALGSLKNPELINLIQARGIDAVLVRSSAACESVTWGELKHTERIAYYSKDVQSTVTVNLCTYFVTHQKKPDPVFIRFDQGFTPSANAPDQSNVVFREGGEGSFAPTYDDFTTPYKGAFRMTATLHNRQHSGDEWLLTSSKGAVITQGTFTNGGLAFIDVTLDEVVGMKLKIVSADHIPLGQVYIADTIATKLE